MSDRDKLKQWLARIRPDLPGAEVLDLLCERYSGPQFSPGDVEEQFPADREREVLATLQLLARTQTGVLRGRWLFFDAEGDVDEALKNEAFFHPRSGARIVDYEERIGLVYEPGPNFPTRKVHTKGRRR